MLIFTTQVFIIICVYLVCCFAFPPQQLADDYYDEINKILSYQPFDTNVQEPNEPIEDQIWPEYPVNVGQVSGLDVDSRGNLYVFHRGNRIWNLNSFDLNGNYQFADQGPITNDTILTLDRNSGKLLNAGFKNKFYLPHGLTIDRKGNIWTTDVATHQVLRFPPNSEEESLILGEKFVPGKDDKHFCKPTDVAVASNGDFFVSDGYCNSRIIKFSSNGTKITEWGNTPEVFRIPHSLALCEKKNMICVADRENERIVCYSDGLNSNGPSAGHKLFVLKDENMGRVYAIANHGNWLYAVTGDTDEIKATGLSIYIPDRTIVNSWESAKGFSQPHALAISPYGKELYVGEIGPNLITKFMIELV